MTTNLRLAVVEHDGHLHVVRHDLEQLDLRNTSTCADIIESIVSMVEVLTEPREEH